MPEALAPSSAAQPPDESRCSRVIHHDSPHTPHSMV